MERLKSFLILSAFGAAAAVAQAQSTGGTPGSASNAPATTYPDGTHEAAVPAGASHPSTDPSTSTASPPPSSSNPQGTTPADAGATHGADPSNNPSSPPNGSQR